MHIFRLHLLFLRLNKSNGRQGKISKTNKNIGARIDLKLSM